MKIVFKQLLVFCTFITATLPLSAEVLLSWDFDQTDAGNSLTIPNTYQSSHIQSSSFKINGSLTPINRANSAAYRNITGAASMEQAIQKQNYIEFSIAAETGYAFQLESFEIRLSNYSSTKGIPYFSIRTSIDDFSGDSDIFKLFDGESQNVPLHTFTTENFPNLSTLTFRIYVFDESGTGNPYNTYVGFGNLAKADAAPDIILSGTIVPVSDY